MQSDRCVSCHGARKTLVVVVVVIVVVVVVVVETELCGSPMEASLFLFAANTSQVMSNG